MSTLELLIDGIVNARRGMAPFKIAVLELCECRFVIADYSDEWTHVHSSFWPVNYQPTQPNRAKSNKRTFH